MYLVFNTHVVTTDQAPITTLYCFVLYCVVFLLCCVASRRVASYIIGIYYCIILFMCGFELSKDIHTLKSLRENGLVIVSIETVIFIENCISMSKAMILLKHSPFCPLNQAASQYNNAESGGFRGINNTFSIPVGWSVVDVTGHDIENKVVVTIYTYTMCLCRPQSWPMITTKGGNWWL